MAYAFNESYYIASKLALLNKNNVKDGNGNDFTKASLKALLTESFGSVQNHYEQAGRGEGLNPNPYFNEFEYLAAKADQLNSIRFDSRTDWTSDQVKAFFAGAGILPVVHYETAGCYETDSLGRYINPSNAFDANAYWSAKLYTLQMNDPAGDWTMNKMVEVFKGVGLSPVSHYVSAGADEAAANLAALVQTVPSTQRVDNDPVRGDIGDSVPRNNDRFTPVPKDNNARPAQNPEDVGGLVDDDIFPSAPTNALYLQLVDTRGYLEADAPLRDNPFNQISFEHDGTRYELNFGTVKGNDATYHVLLNAIQNALASSGLGKLFTVTLGEQFINYDGLTGQPVQGTAIVLRPATGTITIDGGSGWHSTGDIPADSAVSATMRVAALASYSAMLAAFEMDGGTSAASFLEAADAVEPVDIIGVADTFDTILGEGC